MTRNRPIRAVIVDDERLARASLRSLLRSHQDVQVIGETESIAATKELVRRMSPDVLFLDVCLSGENGFDALATLQACPRVVIVTGHAEFAVQAFQANAVDFLVKPVDPARLALTLERIRQARAFSAEARSVRLDAEDTLFLQINGRYHFIRIRSIRCITAEGPYTRVSVDDGRKGLATHGLKEWESRLPEKMFLRIHRSALVNLEFVERVESDGESSYLLHLKDCGGTLRMSHRCFARIRNRMC